MRKLFCQIILAPALIVLAVQARAQQPSAFQLPESFHFDYEVQQQVSGDNKNSTGPHTVIYYYSQKGDYMAIQAAEKNNNLIIYAKDGTTIVIDNQKKSITIFNMSNMLAAMKNAPQYNQHNPANQPKQDNGNAQGGKTGRSKQVSGYQAEEYAYTNNKGEKASVWFAKVDFDVSLFHQFSSGGSAGPGMSQNKMPQSPSYPQPNDPNLLAVETKNNSHPGEGLTTQSIAKKSTVIETKGYTVNNLSNMMGR